MEVLHRICRCVNSYPGKIASSHTLLCQKQPAIPSAALTRPYPSARSRPVPRIPRHIVMDMPGFEERHSRPEMVSNGQIRAGSKMTRSRIGGFEGFHRRIAGSGRSRIVPCCDARSMGDYGRRFTLRMRSGSKFMLKPGGALVGRAIRANNR